MQTFTEIVHLDAELSSPLAGIVCSTAHTLKRTFNLVGTVKVCQRFELDN